MKRLDSSHILFLLLALVFVVMFSACSSTHKPKPLPPSYKLQLEQGLDAVGSQSRMGNYGEGGKPMTRLVTNSYGYGH